VDNANQSKGLGLFVRSGGTGMRRGMRHMTVVVQGANMGLYDGCTSRIWCDVNSTKAGGGENRHWQEQE